LIDICPRCYERKRLAFRVRSDVIDEIVCAVCALAALQVDLDVERIAEEHEKASR